jgi:nucleoside-diphosphate-sugar epimerase
MQGRTAFVTGATGFLGSFLVTFLLEKGYRVIALVRGPHPRARLLDVLHEVSNGKVETVCDERLQVVEGDVRNPGCGLTADVQHALAREVDEIWHCAASFKFQERDREDVYAQNVIGTRHLLDFARDCNHEKTAPFFYVSTAYAAPVKNGVAEEDIAPVGAHSHNLYERSKQEAERLVDQYHRDFALPVAIFRPSIIIGHTQTGQAVRFSGYYDVLRALALLVRNLEVNLTGNFDRNLRVRIRARSDTPLNLVPVDFVVEAMWRLSCIDRRDAVVFNIVNETPVLVSELFRYACEEVRVTGIDLVEEASLQQRPMTTFERLFDRRTRFQAPYLLDGPSFRTTHFRSLIPPCALPCTPVDKSLMKKMNRYYLEILDRQFVQPDATAVLPSAVASAPASGRGVAVDLSLSERLKTVIPLWKDQGFTTPLGSLSDCAVAA